MASAVSAVLALSWTLASPSSPTPALWTAPGWYLAEGADADRLANEELTWLSQSAVPGSGGPYADMARDALLDLHRLTLDNGAVVAGAGSKWAYVWPRDAAFAAVAFFRTGHVREAEAALAFLARRQSDDGGFAARYLSDGSGVPDGRPQQDDGPGWFLWAADQITLGAWTAGPVTRQAADRSLARLLRQTRGGTSLPPVTPDYWEVPQDRVSLGVVAPMLAGLTSAAGLYARLGDDGRARAAGAAARSLRETIAQHFGPSYQRFGDRGGRDAALGMLLPPFGPPDPAVLTAWRQYQLGALRPAGGLAPGTAWRSHQESWTPETALVAWNAAALGDEAAATAWLDWLDSARTEWGALPEKVLANGRPAGPAPLAWTGALVLLTLTELGTSARYET